MSRADRGDEVAPGLGLGAALAGGTPSVPLAGAAVGPLGGLVWFSAPERRG